MFAESIRIVVLPDSAYGGEAECSILYVVDRVGSRTNETIEKLFPKRKLKLSRKLLLYRTLLFRPRLYPGTKTYHPTTSTPKVVYQKPNL